MLQGIMPPSGAAASPVDDRQPIALSAATAVSTASLRHNRSFRVLLTGSTVSMLGSRLTTIAYPMLVLWLTKSPVYAGLAVFAATAPSILFYIPAGILVDRWNPRRTMLRAEIGRGVAVTLIVLTVLSYRSHVLIIVVLALIEEILEVFAVLAERRYIMAVVDPRHTPAALVRSEARTHIALLAGRPLGGLLFEIGPSFPFIADLFSFLVSAVTLIALKGDPGDKSTPKRAQSAQDVFAGLKWVAWHSFARYAMPLASFMTLIAQALIMVFLYDAKTRRLPSVEIGFFLAASGMGGSLGALVGANVRIFSRYSRMALQLLVWTVSFFALWVATSSGGEWYMVAVMLMMSFTGAMSNIEFDTYVARDAGEAIARVTSVGRLLTFTASAAGPAAGGMLAGTLGTHTAVLVLFSATSVLAAFGWLMPSIRNAPVSLVAEPAIERWAARLQLRSTLGSSRRPRTADRNLPTGETAARSRTLARRSGCPLGEIGQPGREPTKYAC